MPEDKDIEAAQAEIGLMESEKEIEKLMLLSINAYLLDNKIKKKELSPEGRYAGESYYIGNWLASLFSGEMNLSWRKIVVGKCWRKFPDVPLYSARIKGNWIQSEKIAKKLFATMKAAYEKQQDPIKAQLQEKQNKADINHIKSLIFDK